MLIKSMYCLTALLLGTGTLFAQTMKIRGALQYLEGKDIYIISSGKRDTLKVTDGKFSGSIEVGAEPEKRRFFFNTLGMLVWVEEGELRISGSAKDFKTIKIEGGKTESDYREYARQVEAARAELGKLFAPYANDSSEAARKARAGAMSAAYEVMKKVTTAFITSHPASFQSLDLLTGLNAEHQELMVLFDNLDPKIRNSKRGKGFHEQMVASSRSAVGQSVLAFTRDDVNGAPVSVASYRGRYVLIDFWASWCKPCRAENPNVLAAYNKYKDQNFTVLSVSIDDDVDKWKQAIREDGLPWTQVRDRKDRKSEILDYYGITGIPSTLLVGPDGKIIARNLRGEMLHKKLEEVIAKTNN